MAAKDRKGKDVMGKIIAFLRANGREVNVGASTTMATSFSCSVQAIFYALDKLATAGVIKKVKDSIPRKQGACYTLNEQFETGDGWREALKKKSHGGKPKAEPAPEVHDRGCSEECLRLRKTLLLELADVYSRLKTCQEELGTCQGEKRALESENETLKARIIELEGLAQKRSTAYRQLKDEVSGLTERVRRLRAQTSPPPVAERTVEVDGSGAMILPGEGLPDTK